MRSVNAERKVESGTVDSDGNLTLTIASGGKRPPTKVEGKLVSGELHIMMRTGANQPPVEVAATRAPAGAGMPPEKIPPPTLHKVPYNGLAKTPRMGWNSWNKFAASITMKM